MMYAPALSYGNYTADYHLQYEEILRKHSMTWFPSTRNGDTGQGHTCEFCLFGKTEDNHAEADWLFTEIKTTSITSRKARVRLFTLNWGTELLLFNMCGKVTDPLRPQIRRLCRTLRASSKPTKWGEHEMDMQLCLDYSMTLTAGSLTSMISEDQFQQRLDNKVTNLVMIHTQKRPSLHPVTNNPWKEYRYTGMDYYGGIRHDVFWDYMKTGVFATEFRLKGDSNSLKLEKDNGTCWNLTKDKLADLYDFHYTCSWA